MKVLSNEELTKELRLLSQHETGIGIDTENMQITSNKDLVVMSISDYNGENPASEAIKCIVADFENNNLFFEESCEVLVHFQINSKDKFMEAMEAMEIIYCRCENENIHKEPAITVGTSCSNDFKDNYVRATVFIKLLNKLI